MTDRNDIAMLRTKHLKETDLVSTKQRFALFSQPPPLSIGDDSYDFKKIPARDETNKPVTMPRNPCASAQRIGKDPSVYFTKVGYTTIGDLYIDPDRKYLQYELEKKKKITNEAIFKPANGYKTIVTGSYEHKSDYTHKEKNYRDTDGRVITHPPNPLAGIKGSTSLYKFPEFMQDPYERKREMEIRDRKAHHAKLGEKPPFRTTEFGNKPFGSDKQTYGLEQKQPEKKNFPETKYNILSHEAPFKPSNPSKKGHNGYLNPYPKYMGNPIRVPKRIDQEANKDVFKPNHGGNLTRPTPTITCNPINIRREMARTTRN